MEKFKEIFEKVVLTLFAIFWFCVMSFFYSSLNDLQTKIIFTPFIVAGASVSILLISRAYNLAKLEEIGKKIYTYLFVSFYFIMISMVTIENFTNGANFGFHLYTGMFWLLGFFLFYCLVIKKNWL